MSSTANQSPTRTHEQVYTDRSSFLAGAEWVLGYIRQNFVFAAELGVTVQQKRAAARKAFPLPKIRVPKPCESTAHPGRHYRVNLDGLLMIMWEPGDASSKLHPGAWYPVTSIEVADVPVVAALLADPYDLVEPPEDE